MIRVDKNKLAIFGVSFHAQKCLYKLNRDGKDIDCYFDNNLYGETYRGKTVLKPTQKNVDGKFILVAVSEKYYQTIRKQLIEMGLIEFKDFMYYTLLNKKIAIMYGNCHIEIMKSFLQSSKEFMKRYAFYPMPVIMEMNSSMMTKEVLENCDLFLAQDIRRENPYGEEFSVDIIINKLSSKCVLHIIPNLFKLGGLYFPQYRYDFNNCNNDSAYIEGRWDLFGFFPFKDSIIDCLVEMGMDAESIISKCTSGKNFTIQEIEKCKEECINKIRKREDKWDIKCADFIEKNYKEHRLFYEPEHPTNFLFRYICKEMLALLNIYEDIHTDNNLGNYETPIYPEVKAYLGLNFDVEKVRSENDSRSLGSVTSYEEYIMQYLWWRHKKG